MKRTQSLLVAALTVVMIVAFPARASHADFWDPDDTKGVLDIRYVKSWGSVNPARTITTQWPWKKRAIWDAGYFLVFFDTFGTNGVPDYYLMVRSTGSKLEATLWRDRVSKPDRLVGSGTTYKTGKRVLVMRASLGMMKIGQARTTYDWYVRSLLSDRKCSSVCVDRAPDTGVVTDPVPPSLLPD